MSLYVYAYCKLRCLVFVKTRIDVLFFVKTTRMNDLTWMREVVMKSATWNKKNRHIIDISVKIKLKYNAHEHKLYILT